MQENMFQIVNVKDLNWHCGECPLIDYCDEPYSDVAICMETRYQNINVEEAEKALKLANDITKGGKQDVIDVAYRIINET